MAKSVENLTGYEEILTEMKEKYNEICTNMIMQISRIKC